MVNFNKNQIIFLLILAFLIGLFLRSYYLYKAFLLFISFSGVFLFLFLFKKDFLYFYLFLFSLFVVFGGVYLHIYDFISFKKNNILFNQKIVFYGVVESNPKIALNYQQFYLELRKPYQGKILVKTLTYPKYQYGDLLKLEGNILKINQNFAYLLKDRVYGQIYYPQIELIKKHQKNFLLEKMFSFKNKIVSIFQKYLPLIEANLLSGLVLGEVSELPKDFKEKMNKTGTTHIVALSGYNISIFSILIFNFFRKILTVNLTIIFVTILILIFVIMTGAEASIVRAAIMGLILMLAQNSKRDLDFKNVIIFTGFIMCLINPYIIRFDLGFQLSFLALIGVIYLKNFFIEVFKINFKNDFFSLKENFFTTLSAQLMVLPVLINYFQYLSLFSILANIFILNFIPLTMFLGFWLIILDKISYYFALLLSWFLAFILKYKIFVIDFFSNFFGLTFSKTMHWVLILLYYALWLFLINYGKIRKIFERK